MTDSEMEKAIKALSRYASGEKIVWKDAHRTMLIGVIAVSFDMKTDEDGKTEPVPMENVKSMVDDFGMIALYTPAQLNESDNLRKIASLAIGYLLRSDLGPAAFAKYN